MYMKLDLTLGNLTHLSTSEKKRRSEYFDLRDRVGGRERERERERERDRERERRGIRNN